MLDKARTVELHFIPTLKPNTVEPRRTGEQPWQKQCNLSRLAKCFSTGQNMMMSTREQIIGAADSLFYSGSIREVSVDRIAERAGVTKKTIYYHFKSKDDLVAAYLEARLRPTIERYQSWAGESGTLPDRIERMFLKLARNAEKRSWKGCGFLRAAVELADSPGHPAIDVARRHKAEFETWLAADIRDAGYNKPDQLARVIMVLLDGAVARMLVQRDPAYARDAATAARQLLETQHATKVMYTD